MKTKEVTSLNEPLNLSELVIVLAGFNQQIQDTTQHISQLTASLEGPNVAVNVEQITEKTARLTKYLGYCRFRQKDLLALISTNGAIGCEVCKEEKIKLKRQQLITQQAEMQKTGFRQCTSPSENSQK